MGQGGFGPLFLDRRRTMARRGEFKCDWLWRRYVAARRAGREDVARLLYKRWRRA